MKAARDSLLRRFAGVSAGIILGCGAAVTALVVLADFTSRADGGSAAWAVGAGLIRLGYGPAIIIGALVGSWFGRRFIALPMRRTWARRPSGTLFNHYPVALLGGVIIGAASSFFTIPAARAVVDTLFIYGDMVAPRILRTTSILMIAVVSLGVLSVARWTVHALDRDIYVRRRLLKHRSLEAPTG
jgi:hypothetical protein